MSLLVPPPTASTTLVAMLGASAWPNSPGYPASEAFAHAAQGFKEYMLDPDGFGLAVANLLDLFDAPTGVSEQLARLSTFLEERTRLLFAASQTVRDVLVYFVGHGGFVGSSADFYLLPQQANTSILRASGMSIEALADVLREKARQTRRYLFLDCCFSAAAFRFFQGGPDQIAILKTRDAFAVPAKGKGYPSKGTVLFCSSDQHTPSLLLPDESCTMFSHALLDVLRKGDPHRLPQLSLRDLKDLVNDQLALLPNAPRPALHSPDQSEGDVADIPFFPNFLSSSDQTSLDASVDLPVQTISVAKLPSQSEMTNGEGPYVITQPCIGVKDASCVDVCPVDCIHPTPNEPEFAKAKQLYINPDECIECGACEPACPVTAIFQESTVPDEWKHFIPINAGFFR